MRLSIVIPTRSDRLIWSTLNALQMDHAHIFADGNAEIVVIDSSPEGSPIAAALKKHTAGDKLVRYVRYIGVPSSCLYKEAGFREAKGEIVVCMDSHVLFERGGLDAVLNHFALNPESRDLLMAVCKKSASSVQGTNQMIYADEPYALPAGAVVVNGVVFRGDKVGAWIKDDRGLNPLHPPFEIQQQGTFAFAMRREAWPGFHPAMTGFGGNETYLMESVRHAGGRVLCVPAWVGVHDFMNDERHDYTLSSELLIRNYLVGAEALAERGAARGAQLRDALRSHFAKASPKPYAAAARRVPDELNVSYDLKPFTGKEKPEAVRKAQEKQGSFSDPYLAKWQEAGGDLSGAVPKDLFVMLCHQPRNILGDDGEPRPLRSLEFGCGLSTLAFDRQKIDHTAIEDNPVWIDRVNPLLKGESVKLLHRPLKDGWYDWEPQYGDLYDLILIDGPFAQNRPEARLPAMERVARCLAARGTIIIDDTHREAEQRMSRELAQRLDLTVRHVESGGRAYDVLHVPRDVILGQGPGTILKEFLATLKMPECQQCFALAVKMNRKGAAWCRENIEEIVADMLPRARDWWANRKPWMSPSLWFKGQGSIWSRIKSATGGVDELLRESIRAHVTAAIETAERPQSGGATDAA